MRSSVSPFKKRLAGKQVPHWLPPAAKMMFAACASPGRPDADRVMSLLTEKIEQKVGSMAATKITRELRRVLKPAADKDGFLSSKALAEMLRRTWLVGVERDSLEVFAEQLTQQQKHGKLSIDTFALCVARAATGNPVVTPPKARQVEVRTPEDNGLYVDPLQGANVAPPTDASSSKLRSLLAEELRRVERDRMGEMAHANEVDAAARSLLQRRCRALCERGSKQTQRRLPLAQWCVALRGLAIAVGLPPPSDQDLAELWRDCDRGDFVAFGREMFSSEDDEHVACLPSRPSTPASPPLKLHADDWKAPLPDLTTSLGAPSPLAMHGFDGNGHLVAWSRPCRTILVGTGCFVAERRLDTTTQRLETVPGVTCVCAHNTKPICAAHGVDGLRVWSIGEPGKTVAKGLFETVSSIAFLGAGSLIALVGVYDARPLVAVVNYETGEVLGEAPVDLDTRDGSLLNVAAAATGTSFATVGDGSHVAFWRLIPQDKGGGLKRSEARFPPNAKRPSAFTCVAFDPRSAKTCLVAGTDGRVRVFREKHEVAAFAAHEGSVASIDAVQRGSLCVAVTSGSDGCVRRWAGEQLSSAGRCRLLKNGTVVKCCLIDDAEDDYALCATERGTVLTCVPGADDKKNICRSPAKTVDQSKVAAVVVTGHFAPVTCLAAHPSQSAFATCGADSRVITWDADQGSKLRHTSLESCGSSIKYDEKGRYLFVGSEQGTVSMLDASTLDIIRTHNVFKCPVTSISASPDSKLIAACSRRGDVVVLDEERVLASLRTGSGACVIAADFGRDAKRRLVFRTRGDDGVVDYWRLDGRRTRRLFRVEDLPGSEPWAWRSGFAEGRCVASNMKGVVAVADDDGLELRTGAGDARGAFRGVSYDAAAMAFLADGQRLLTAARGARAAVVWDAARET
jgi:WD40 repeat protein